MTNPLARYLANNPAARARFAQREAESRAVLAARPVDRVSRKWQIDSGAVFAPAGAVVAVTLEPQCLFRCEKIMATDDSANPGAATRVLSVTVGNKVQKLGPSGNGTLTQFFSAQALANGISFDTAQPYEDIIVRVKFTQQCNWELSAFGTAAVEQ